MEGGVDDSEEEEEDEGGDEDEDEDEDDEDSDVDEIQLPFTVPNGTEESSEEELMDDEEMEKYDEQLAATFRSLRAKLAKKGVIWVMNPPLIIRKSKIPTRVLVQNTAVD